MHKSCAWVLLLAVSLAAGCGGSQKQPVEPKKVIGGQAGAEIKPELTPLGPPKDVIAVARIERLESASSMIARWMNVPFDLRMLDALGPGLSRTLNPSAPVEAVVALADGTDTELTQPYAVFSAGLTSLEAGRTLFEKFGRKLEELSAGIWITVDENPITCAIAPALGRASVRMVCGDRRVDIENLLPYATRGLPMLAMGSADAHLELRLAPLRDRYGVRLKQGKAVAVPMALAWMGIADTRISRPVTDILYALGDEVLDVVDDVDRISIDARFATGPERLDVSTSLSFARARSWVAQAVADSAKRAAPAPATFFALPEDSGAASYVIPSNPRLFETIAHRLESLADGVLSHFEVNQKVREDFVRSIDRYASQSWGGACGEGAPAQAAEGKQSESSLLNTINAWQVCAYDALPAAALTDVLDSAGKLVADKKSQELLGEGSFSVRRRAAGRALPTGSLLYEVRINTAAFEAAASKWSKKAASTEKQTKPPKVDASKTGTIYIYVVPDTNRTWVGSGTDAKAIEAHLATARTPGSAGHLAMPELEWLRQTPAVAGGFVSMAHLGEMLAARGSKQGISKSRVEQAFAVAPHHGRTPIPFTFEVRGSSSAPELLLNARLDKALFEDLVAISGQAILKAK